MLVAITGDPPQADDSRRNRAFVALAVASSKYDMNCCITTPNTVRLRGETLSGWTCSVHNHQMEWIQNRYDAQGFVAYDAMYLSDLKRDQRPYRRLLRRFQQRHVPVFNPILKTKDRVYRRLMRESRGAYALPETFFDVTTLQVIRLLNEYGVLWLKPTIGSGGRNMMMVTQESRNEYSVVADRFFGDKVRQYMSRSQLYRFIENARRERTYMAQVHVPLLQTEDHRCVDLRVSVQRDVDGQWYVTAVTGRCGAPDSYLTNYHAGGQITSLTNLSDERAREWLRHVGMTHRDVHRATHASIVVAETLQTAYPTLGMLGIDVGQTNSGAQYIYDCNGRPGRDILTDEELETYMYRIAGFSHYLFKRSYPQR